MKTDYGTGGNFMQNTSSTLNTQNMYSTPELIDTKVTDDAIELVYKRYSLISNNWGTPHPQVYKEVYSRTDGSMKTEVGTYRPQQNESYEF